MPTPHLLACPPCSCGSPPAAIISTQGPAGTLPSSAGMCGTAQVGRRADGQVGRRAGGAVHLWVHLWVNGWAGWRAGGWEAGEWVCTWAYWLWQGWQQGPIGMPHDFLWQDLKEVGKGRLGASLHACVTHQHSCWSPPPLVALQALCTACRGPPPTPTSACTSTSSRADATWRQVSRSRGYCAGLPKCCAVLCAGPALRLPLTVSFCTHHCAGGEDCMVRVFDLRDGSQAAHFEAAADTGEQGACGACAGIVCWVGSVLMVW